MPKGALAIALHDVEPATFERCALIRDWLTDHGVARVTLLVVPAPDLHPFFQRRPDLADWLLDRRDEGDAIAQHGLAHSRAEFSGLDPEETRQSVAAGRRLLALAGLEPRGFVAPTYAYTPALHRELATSYDWWATLLGVRGAEQARATPALAFGASSAFKRSLAPLAIRAGSRLQHRVLRLDLHPADFDHPRHVLALERALVSAKQRRAVTYDDLCADDEGRHLPDG